MDVGSAVSPHGKFETQFVAIWCILATGKKLTVLQFLADRTNGHAIATLLRLSSSSSVVCLSVTLCIVAKQCVLEQKLLLRAYRKSYMRNRLVPK